VFRPISVRGHAVGNRCPGGQREPFTPHHRVTHRGRGPRTFHSRVGIRRYLGYRPTIQCPRLGQLRKGDILIQPRRSVDSDPPTPCAMPEHRRGNCARNCSAELASRSCWWDTHGGSLHGSISARNFQRRRRRVVLIDSTHWQQGLKVDVTADTPLPVSTAITLTCLGDAGELSDRPRRVSRVNRQPRAWGILPSSCQHGESAPSKPRISARVAVTLQNRIAADFPGPASVRRKQRPIHSKTTNPRCNRVDKRHIEG